MPRPIPGWLKRLLLPGWNAAHHFGWAAREYLGSVVRGKFERCPVCGRTRPMIHRPRVIPHCLVERWGLSSRLTEALVRKESGDCAGCGARLRCRRLARVLLNLYPAGHSPTPASSIAQWVETPEARSLRVAEVNRIDGLHEFLARLPGFTTSDYRPGAAPGAVVEGVRSEDLTRLTYPDESFDLVLTSETLEHVPDLDAALREIRRVLTPGGRHIFTIPVLPGVEQTYPRAVLRPDGSIEDRAPRISHPGGDWGYPVFTEFGADVLDRLQEAGFDSEVRFGPVWEDDLAQVYISRKLP